MRHQGFTQRAPVKGVRAVFHEHPVRPGQFGLQHQLAHPGDHSAREKGLSGSTGGHQEILPFFENRAQLRVYRKSVLCIGDSPGQQGVQSQGAVFFQGGLPAGNGTRHGAGVNARFGHMPVALLPVRFQGGRCRGSARCVEGVDGPPVGHVDQHEQVTADTAHMRFDRCHHQVGGDGRIHGVAAGFQHGRAGLGG